MKLALFDNAIDRYQKILHREGIISRKIDTKLNHDRYKYLDMWKQERWVRYLVTFKREPFHAYSNYNTKGIRTVGESINVEDLKHAIANGCIFIIYLREGGEVYIVRISELLEENTLAEKRTNDKEGKEQYIFPISYLKRVI